MHMFDSPGRTSTDAGVDSEPELGCKGGGVGGLTPSPLFPCSQLNLNQSLVASASSCALKYWDFVFGTCPYLVCIAAPTATAPSSCGALTLGLRSSTKPGLLARL